MSHTTQSWVEGANAPHGFGLSHLPYGAMSVGGAVHLCMRLGDFALDLAATSRSGLLRGLPTELREACAEPALNALAALGSTSWAQLRAALIELLAVSAKAEVRAAVQPLLRRVDEIELVLPLRVGGFTDFYASLDHARRVGELFRPDNPLLPNYKHVPIAYNGRASSIVVSGMPIRRPYGQRRVSKESATPEFAPSAALDYEAELAFVIGGGNRLGEPVAIDDAREQIFGVTLLNDWSARDIQAWEYQPLGPFLGKSFATSISPWITPMAALAPFRVAPAPRAPGDPHPLPYLSSGQDRSDGALDIALEVRLSTVASRAAGSGPMLLSHGNARGLYWTAAQMIAHHTSNGCNLQPGDLLATGTISGPDLESAGCLLELTCGGATAVTLPNGETRAYLLDGDEIILEAWCVGDGVQPVSLGGCRGRIEQIRNASELFASSKAKRA